MLQLIEALEGRSLFADISVVLASTTLASNLTANAAIKPAASATFTISKDSAVLSKTEAKAKLTLTAVLHPAAGADISLGTAKITASALAKKSATAKIAFSKLKIAPAAGSYTIVATLTGQSTAGDTNAANDTATSAAITVAAPTGGSGSTTPFAGSGFMGNVLKFKGKKTNLGGTNRETGTFTSNNGPGGDYNFTFGTGVTDQAGFLAPTGGAPLTLKFHANKGSVTSLTGKTLTFGVTEAESKGYVDYAGGKVYYK